MLALHKMFKMMMVKMRLKNCRSQDNNTLEFVIKEELKHVIDNIGIQEGRTGNLEK